MEKLLVANRGEIAVRVIRTAREMGLQTVAIYSEIDRDALHVRLADEAYLVGPANPAQSYLNIDRVLELAKRAEADAIHPGYGFLAENARFARAVQDAGLIWIGPHPEAIDLMGDKIRARQTMLAAKVPVVPGGTEPIKTLAAAQAAAKRYGFPIALKASGGGGGKGLKVARSAEELGSALSLAQREAEAYFKDSTIYAERYLENPKHIELQLLGDKHGSVVHYGERDCSLQRRHQKLLEEAPPKISQRVRDGIREAGVRAARAMRYDSAGTIEWLVSGDEFFFLEMNTRIQVEHTVTEMIAGVDLVREQIRIAGGEKLGYDQNAIAFSGYAIEGRINAEDPSHEFRPAPGVVTNYREPAGLGVRVDSAAFPGFKISADYDSLVAKLVVWAPARDQALARFRRALDEYVIEGVRTTLPFLRALSDVPQVIDGSYTTSTLELFAVNEYALSPSSDSPRGSSYLGMTTKPNVIPTLRPVSAQAPEGRSETITVEVNDKLYRVRLFDLPSRMRKARREPPRFDRKSNHVHVDADDVVSPMHGVVVEVLVREGQEVATGDVVAVVEAMKMMNEIRAHKPGKIGKLHVKPGETVESRTPLVTFA
ncbi:MAG TPA: acetyl-CoA carboxylase biotin carboxylase subunit [Candidatus Rubrimentiphilum sp.]|nr:acetyl-CoA carboxylase biotin carboxylase subunit [Candidatus Rubrimentiphilum sp.]